MCGREAGSEGVRGREVGLKVVRGREAAGDGGWGRVGGRQGAMGSARELVRFPAMTHPFLRLTSKPEEPKKIYGDVTGSTTLVRKKTEKGKEEREGERRKDETR